MTGELQTTTIALSLYYNVSVVVSPQAVIVSPIRPQLLYLCALMFSDSNMAKCTESPSYYSWS